MYAGTTDTYLSMHFSKKKKKLINAHIYTGKTEVSFKNTKTTSIFIGCPHLMCQETQLDFLSLPLLMWKATL